MAASDLSSFHENKHVGGNIVFIFSSLSGQYYEWAAKPFCLLWLITWVFWTSELLYIAKENQIHNSFQMFVFRTE